MLIDSWLELIHLNDNFHFRDTITSSGPNSFNKGKKGFTNHRRLLEKELKLSK